MIQGEEILQTTEKKSDREITMKRDIVRIAFKQQNQRWFGRREKECGWEWGNYYTPSRNKFSWTERRFESRN